MNLSNTQKKIIRSKAQTIKAIIQIGKNEIGEELCKTILNALDAHELIKIHLLNNATHSKEEAMAILQDTITPDYIYAIGKQIVIFKQSSRKEKRKISLTL